MIDKFWITPTKGDIDKFFITPSEYPAFYITPTTPNITPDEVETPPGGTPSYTWVPYLSTIQWSGLQSSALWNVNVGNFDGAPGILTAPSQYNYVKLVAGTGGHGYWKRSSGLYCGSLDLKSMVECKRVGSGTNYAASGDAAADWAGSSGIIRLGSTKQFTYGYYDSIPGSCSGNITGQLYLSA